MKIIKYISTVQIVRIVLLTSSIILKTVKKVDLKTWMGEIKIKSKFWSAGSWGLQFSIVQKIAKRPVGSYASWGMCSKNLILKRTILL